MAVAILAQSKGNLSATQAIIITAKSEKNTEI
jgi:hypothetical protein